jgi:hypothetical protein
MTVTGVAITIEIAANAMKIEIAGNIKETVIAVSRGMTVVQGHHINLK